MHIYKAEQEFPETRCGDGGGSVLGSPGSVAAPVLEYTARSEEQGLLENKRIFARRDNLQGQIATAVGAIATTGEAISGSNTVVGKLREKEHPPSLHTGRGGEPTGPDKYVNLVI